MARINQLGERRTVFRVSSSISNFYPKLKAYLKLDDWHWWRNRNDRVIFFGLYHWKDYLRFIWHRGPKKVFWCGSDLLNLEKAYWIWRKIIFAVKAKHYVENEVEMAKLQMLDIGRTMHHDGIHIRPMLFDDPDKYQVDNNWPKQNWFITYHKERELEYGKHIADFFPWIDVIDGLSPEEFNLKIKSYQGAIRFNEFDGFSENLAKSLLMGQWPISKIYYPGCIGLDQGLDYAIQLSRIHQEPNYKASNYWRKTLKENKEEVVNNW